MDKDTGSKSRKQRRRRNDDLVFEIADGGEMSLEDLDEVLTIMANVIIRKYEQSLLTDTSHATTLTEQLELNFE